MRAQLWKYVAKRLLSLIPLLLIISVATFVLIQLPPGDFLSTYMVRLAQSGTRVEQDMVDALRVKYGLDKPVYVQYFMWMKAIITEGNLGWSFLYSRPINDLIAERIGLTMMMAIMSILVTWLIAIPVSIFSATHPRSLGDYVFSFLTVLGMAVPGFLLAMLFIYTVFVVTGHAITGVVSAEYIGKVWNFEKYMNVLSNMWAPAIVVGMAGTAGTIRVLRGMLMDELKKQYVVTATAKGMGRVKMLIKYPIRVAVNPMISTIGWMLPTVVSGETLVSLVFNVPSIGPLMTTAMQNQDMYLAGSILLILSALTTVGTLLSDILLVLVDPRIRFQEVSA